jgi:hypothetical protein
MADQNPPAGPATYHAGRQSGIGDPAIVALDVERQGKYLSVSFYEFHGSA